MTSLLTRKWTQGHSTGLGVLIGVSLVSYRGWLIFAAGVLVGAALVFALAGGYRFARTLLDGFEVWKQTSRAKAAKLNATPVPVYSTRKRRGLVDEGVPY